jgi:hypothetical protein
MCVVSAVLGGIGTAASLGLGLAGALQDPKAPKSAMPGVAVQPLRSPQPAGAPFMNRNQIQMRESAARRMLGGQ